jgi:hypothetical protein
MDQIITCIFSQFHPYIVLSYKHPDIDTEVRCALQWNGNVNFSYPIDAPATTSYRIIGDTGLVLYAWIFKNSNNPYGIIHKIDTTFTAVSNVFDDYTVMHNKEDDIHTDIFTISGRPLLLDAIPNPYSFSISDNGSIILDGDMLNFVTDVAISPTSATPYYNVYPASAYSVLNPFVSNVKLSGTSYPFTAVQLLSSEWQHVDNNHLMLNIPEPLTAGFFDVYVWDSMGLGRLTLDSQHLAYNPYPLSSVEYVNYEPYIQPIVSGIHVSP